MMLFDRRRPPPQRFVSHFLMFSASPLLLHLHLTLMEKTYIAAWDKKRPHLSSNGACSWIMESQLLLTYTVCLFLISVTPFHASPFIKLKYSYTYISVETVRVVEIYHLFEKKRNVRIVVKLQCGQCRVKRNNKNGFNHVPLPNACRNSKQLCSQTLICSNLPMKFYIAWFFRFLYCTSWRHQKPNMTAESLCMHHLSL